MNDVATTGGDRKRAEKTKRLFLNEAGEAFPRANLESVAGKVIFVGTGEELTFRFEDLSPEIARAAALFGIMTSVTNTVGRADMSEDEMIEAAAARLSSILEDGRWSAERQSGPRTSDLLEAASRWYAERGKQFTEEMRQQMQAKLADEETGTSYRANLMANVAAHFHAIKAERAQARAEKAKTAGSAEVDDLL